MRSRIALRRFGRRRVAQLPLDAAEGEFGIGDARRVALGAAFEHRERREKQAARPLRAVQRLVSQAEIVQIVGDERVRRAEPHLIDRGRLLQWRQRVLGPVPAQIQVSQLRQAARGLRCFGAVPAPVERERLVERPLGVLEALQRGERGAERPQRFGRSVPRVASCRIRRRGWPRRAPRRHRRGRAPPAPSRRKSPPRAHPCCASGSISAAMISSGSASSQRRRSICARANAAMACAVVGDSSPSAASAIRSTRRRSAVTCARSPARRRSCARRFEQRQQGRAVCVCRSPAPRPTPPAAGSPCRHRRYPPTGRPSR